jgi:hypothetical protein
MPTKMQIEHLEQSLVNSPLPSVTGSAVVLPQLMVDFPTPLDDLEPVRINIRLKNDEGFPVTLHATNHCNVLSWTVIQENIIIENSGVCDTQFDPVHQRFGAKEAKYFSEVIMLTKKKYHTGWYTLKAWYYGVPIERKFFVEKIDLTKLTKEAQSAMSDKELKEFHRV